MSIEDTSLLLRAAAHAAAHQHFPRPALYVAATPIGNLADITLRALHGLALADAVAAEDTRVAGALLQKFGLAKPLVALHAHNERAAADAVLLRLAAGERVVLVSDAGTPALSDPGALLVAAARAAGFAVVPLPGPSSAVAALSVAGDADGSGFRFVGFVAARGGERRDALAAVAADAATQVLFEAPHRIDDLLQAMAALAPARTLTVARELTKQFETVATMAAADAPAWLEADPNRRRGEFVVVLHAQAPKAAAGLPDAALRTLVPLLRELPLKQAVALAAEISGAPRNALYDEALRRRRAANDGG